MPGGRTDDAAGGQLGLGGCIDGLGPHVVGTVEQRERRPQPAAGGGAGAAAAGRGQRASTDGAGRGPGSSGRTGPAGAGSAVGLEQSGSIAACSWTRGGCRWAHGRLLGCRSVPWAGHRPGCGWATDDVKE